MTTFQPSTGSDRAPAVILRPASESDAGQIVGLLASAQDLRQVSPDEDYPLDERTVRHWIRERAAGHVLIERGKVVAYAELVQDSAVAGRRWIGHMMVDPHRRGLGLGQRLVHGLLEIAKDDERVREVAISAFIDNPRALQCYRACGFRDRGRVWVGERELLELRYPIPDRQPAVGLVPAAGGVAVGVSVGALTLLVSRGGFDWVSAIPLLSILVLAAWGAHAVVPERRHPRAYRLGRTALYPLGVGAAAFAVAVVLHFARGLDLARMAGAIGAGTAITAVLLLLAADRAGRVKGARR